MILIKTLYTVFLSYFLVSLHDILSVAKSRSDLCNRFVSIMAGAI